MKKITLKITFLLTLFFLGFMGFAQASFEEVKISKDDVSKMLEINVPLTATVYDFNVNTMQSKFNSTSKSKINFPNSEGETTNYNIEESYNSDKLDSRISDIEEVKKEVYDKIWTKELARASSVDGSVKILTQSIKHPTNKASVGSTEYDLKPIDFHQHAIRSIRPSENLDDKKFNSRWYFEKEGESKIAWWCNRDQMISMIEDANKKGMLKSSLDNTRINNYKEGLIYFKEYDDIIRAKRNELLQKTDYLMLADSNIDEEYLNKVKLYRQELRDFMNKLNNDEIQCNILLHIDDFVEAYFPKL